MPPIKDPLLSKSLSCAILKYRIKKFPGHGGQLLASQQFGVSQPAWAKWERGKITPNDFNQRRLADFFGITLAELRGEDGVAAGREASPGDAFTLALAGKDAIIEMLRAQLLREQERADKAETRATEAEVRLRALEGELREALEARSPTAAEAESAAVSGEKAAV